jgi:tryptophan 7-halogenase
VTGDRPYRVVIVGGGSAGWLTACVLAARQSGLAIILVESPDIPTIGVGEGTWPTMR